MRYCFQSGLSMPNFDSYSFTMSCMPACRLPPRAAICITFCATGFSPPIRGRKKFRVAASQTIRKKIAIRLTR